jgi:hypothetical protein
MQQTLAIVLIDETAGAATTGGEKLTPAALAAMALAIQTQLNDDVAPEWGGAYTVRAGANSKDVRAGETVFAVLKDLPDAPGAIAYHDVAGNAVPFALDAITLNDNLFGPGVSLSSSISHECCEMAGDLDCNLWADNGNGEEVAHELCDAVELEGYPITVTSAGAEQAVWVSNFLLKAFFAAGAPAPYDFLSTTGQGANDAPPAAPFQTANGNGGNYQIVRSTTQAQDVTAQGGNAADASAALRPPRRMPPPPPHVGPPTTKAPPPPQRTPEQIKSETARIEALVKSEQARREKLWGKKDAPRPRVYLSGTPARAKKRAHWSSRTFRRGARA